MNCQDFNNRLYEYLDEALDLDDRAAASAHLQQCSECRRALRREQAAAKSLHDSLDRATVGLSLRPETRRNILRALKPKSTSLPSWACAWQWFMASAIRPVGAGTALLAALLLLGYQVHRRAAQNSPAIVRTGAHTWVIDVPILTQTHVFQRHNDTVVDALVPVVTVGHGHFFEHNKP